MSEITSTDSCYNYFDAMCKFMCIEDYIRRILAITDLQNKSTVVTPENYAERLSCDDKHSLGILIDKLKKTSVEK